MKYKLSHLIDITHGYAFKGEYFSEEPTNLILLTPGNVQIGGGFSFDKKKYYRIDGPIDEKYIFQPGEMFLTMTDLSKAGDTLGYPAIIPEINGYKLLHNQRLGRIRLKKPELLDFKYLYYVFCTREYRHHVLSTSTGSTVKHTSPQKIAEYELELPNLETQRKVAEILSNLDKKIFLNKKISDLLEQISHNLFKNWFIDFEFPNEQGLPYKSSGGNLVGSELGEIPEGWKVVSIGEVCDANTKNLTKMNQWKYINYLDTGNITCNYIDNIQYFNLEKEKIPSRAKRIIQPNDIVYSTVRPNQQHHGLIKKPVNNMVASTGFVVLTSNGLYSTDLIYLWLSQKDTEEKLQAIAEQSTSAYPSIKPNDILSINILQPNEKQLVKFNNSMEKINRWLWDSQLENKKLISIRDTLLPKLLSGEIEIPDESVVK